MHADTARISLWPSALYRTSHPILEIRQCPARRKTPQLKIIDAPENESDWEREQ